MPDDAYTNQVIASVIERSGQFLICRRPAHKRHGNLWEFPGGKIEPGESLLQAARRELSEELALDVESVGEIRYSVVDRASGLTINFVDVKIKGTPQLLEHSALDWLAPADLLKLPLAPSDRQFAEQLSKQRSTS